MGTDFNSFAALTLIGGQPVLLFGFEPYVVRDFKGGFFVDDLYDSIDVFLDKSYGINEIKRGCSRSNN